MPKKLSIIFPFRDRDATRVRTSLQSLEMQTNKVFEVIFIDYGSQDHYAKEVEDVVSHFDFARYHYVGHPGLLWNKSKALNFGIKSANGEYIVTADIDALFVGNFIEEVLALADSSSYSLFKIGYLSEMVTQQQQKELNFDAIESKFVGDTFGIGLYPKSVIEKIGGVDEFFHFYGSEDQDFNFRVELTGTGFKSCEETLLYHQWHPRYPQKSHSQLTQTPRLTNVLRINQRHFLRHQDGSILHPNFENWGSVYKKTDALALRTPKFKIELSNITSHVNHFFGEEIKRYANSVIEVTVTEAPYFKSLKYQVKKYLGKQTQPYISMKAVNDLMLSAIVYTYRDYNYSYVVSEDLKQVCFTIDLNTNHNHGI